MNEEKNEKGFLFHLKKLMVFIVLCVLSIGLPAIPTFLPLLRKQLGLSYGLAATGASLGLFVMLGLFLLIGKRLGLKGRSKLITKENILIILVSYGLMELVSNFCVYLQKDLATGKDTSLVTSTADIPGIVLFISIGLVVPIIEEIVYRGYVLKYWLKDYPIIGVVLSSLIFAISHGYRNNYILVMYIISGAIFALVYLKTKRLESSVLVHIIHNMPGAITML